MTAARNSSLTQRVASVSTDSESEMSDSGGDDNGEDDGDDRVVSFSLLTPLVREREYVAGSFDELSLVFFSLIFFCFGLRVLANGLGLLFPARRPDDLCDG